MTTYSDTTPTQSLWNVIKEKLVASGLYTTNSLTQQTTEVHVYGTYNDKDVRVGLFEAPVSKTELFDKFGGTEGRKDFNVVIMAVTQYSNEADELDDRVGAILKANDIEGVSLQSYESDSSVPISNNSKFHTKMLMAHYIRE